MFWLFWQGWRYEVVRGGKSSAHMDPGYYFAQLGGGKKARTIVVWTSPSIARVAAGDGIQQIAYSGVSPMRGNDPWLAVGCRLSVEA